MCARFLLLTLILLAHSAAAQVTSAPIPTDPGSAIVIDADEYTILGSAVADSLVRVYVDANNNDSIDSGADTVVGSLQLSGGGTVFAVVLGLTQDADNNFLVTAEAAGSSESAAADVPTITEDSTPPVTPVITFPTTTISTDGGDFTITGTAEAGTLIRAYIIYNNDGIIGPGEAMRVAAQQQLSAVETDFALPVYVSQAAPAFAVTSTDEAGNESAYAYVPFDYTGSTTG